MEEQRVLIEVTGSPNACTAAVAMASVWGKGSMIAFMRDLPFFCEWAADRIDEDYDCPTLEELQEAIKGLETLRRQFNKEVRRLLGEEPYPVNPTTPAEAA